jgi:hypothetical protein
MNDLNEKYEKNDIEIGSISFEINQSYFDNYKRTYPRIQSLLAEVMSVISLLFQIAQQIIFFFCDKKMSRDIIRNLLNNINENNIIKKGNINIINKKLQDIKNELLTEKEKMKNEMDEKTNISYSLDKDKNDNKSDLSTDNIDINKSLKKINYYYIIKSFFCFKDKKTKLINLCHNIIIEDLCVERLLRRLYDLERIYNCLTSEEKNCDYFGDNRFNEINKLLYDINNEIENKKVSKPPKKRNSTISNYE